MYERIKKLNPNISLITTNDKEFRRYGQVIDKHDFIKAKKYVDEKIEIDQDRIVYEPSNEHLESLKAYVEFENEIFGGMAIQMGICYGKNRRINMLEYHKSSEVFIAITPCVIFFGTQENMNNNTYDSENLTGVFLNKYEAIEIFGSVIHTAPLHVLDEGFKGIPIIIKGSNVAYDNNASKDGENLISFGRNKWAIVHEDFENKRGRYVGLVGENKEIKY